MKERKQGEDSVLHVVLWVAGKNSKESSFSKKKKKIPVAGSTRPSPVGRAGPCGSLDRPRHGKTGAAISISSGLGCQHSSIKCRWMSEEDGTKKDTSKVRFCSSCFLCFFFLG